MALEASEHLVACPSVSAGIRDTGVLHDLAGFPRVALRTGAVVLIRLCVHAGASIHTRLMATAVVQIFIAEQASPVPVTVTLPGLVAGTMDTSRIQHTLVTELSLPAVATLAFPWA